MSVKSLVNSIENAVTETLFGLSYTYPQLEYQVARKVVLMPNLENRKNKVSVICGGGSGHEPFAAGFVGRGMLTASIAGSIFAAPPSRHITYCIDRVSANNEAGTLMVIPNYTGDCLNFGVALEKARHLGIKMSDVIVNEDCSIPRKELGTAGKRGLSGMVFVIKIAGALAERGLPLDEIHKMSQKVVENMATYAVGLTACALPGQPLMFELSKDEIECGMGIHGEAGYEKIKLMKCSEVVSFMLKHICDALSLHDGDSVAAIVNNFGALSQLEQGIVVHDLVKQLKGMHINPVRVYAGPLVTSLNSAGVHITLLNLPENDKDLLISCLDDPTDAPAWPGCAYSIPLKGVETLVQDITKHSIEKVGIQIDGCQQNLLKQCLKNACENIIQKENFINDLDRGCGDGDCGSTLARLANEILKDIDKYYLSHPAAVFSEMANIAEELMGGTSGALYCLLLTNAAGELALAQEKEGWIQIWFRVLCNGLKLLIKYGKAKPGDRSMIDVLDTVCKSYEAVLSKSAEEICVTIKAAAWQGCESTKTMEPKVGRASYVKQAMYLQNVDAGAYGLATWISAATDTIKNYKN